MCAQHRHMGLIAPYGRLHRCPATRSATMIPPLAVSAHLPHSPGAHVCVTRQGTEPGRFVPQRRWSLGVCWWSTTSLLVTKRMRGSGAFNEGAPWSTLLDFGHSPSVEEGVMQERQCHPSGGGALVTHNEICQPSLWYATVDQLLFLRSSLALFCSNLRSDVCGPCVCLTQQKATRRSRCSECVGWVHGPIAYSSWHMGLKIPFNGTVSRRGCVV